MSRRDGITRTVSARTGKASYRARVSWIDPDGMRQHRSKSHRTRKDAEKWRRDMLTAIDRGDWFEPADNRVDEVAQRWLASVERSRAASTARKYRKVYEGTVKPRYGARKVASLRATEIQTWYDALGERYKANSVAMIHKVMRGIVAHALADGIIRTNPLDGRRLPHDQQEPPVAWDAETVRAFLTASERDDAAIPLVLMVTTGLRIGECLALTWADIDLDARTLRVTKTLQQTAEGVRISTTPKTSSSNRTVALPAHAVLALRRQETLSSGDLVFARPDGRPIRAGTMRDLLARYCRVHHLPAITPHDLRKTAVSLMMARGVHPAIAARQTGHTIAVMLTRYAAVSSELQRQAADALDVALSSDMNDDNTDAENRTP